MNSSFELKEPVELKASLVPFRGMAERAPAEEAPTDLQPLQYSEAPLPQIEIEPTPTAANGNSATNESEAETAIAEPEPDPGPSMEELLAERVAIARKVFAGTMREEKEREVQKIRTSVTAAVEDFAQQREKYFGEVESEVVQLALAIARRIIHRESQIDPHLLAGLVNHELQQMESNTTVRLFVAPEAMATWHEQVPTLNHTVELTVDKNLKGGELRLESSLGSTTIDFAAELKEIERGFLDLLSHRPAVAGDKNTRVQ